MNIHLATGMSNSKQLTSKTVFERRYETLNIRSQTGEINSKSLLAGLALLLKDKK